MKTDIHKFEITEDFIVGNRISRKILSQYSNFPCRIKAGVFLLCVEGSIEASINLSKYTIKRYDLISLVPGNIVQIHQISDDALLYFAAFATEFMTNINFIKSTISFLPILTEYPVIPLKKTLPNYIRMASTC